MNRAHQELAPLLVAFGAAGGEVALHPSEPGGVRYRPLTLPADLVALLKAHRGDVHTLLANGFLATSAESAYIVEERLGVADELAMPTHRGSAAWLVAVGEAIAVTCKEASAGIPSTYAGALGRAAQRDRLEREDSLPDREGDGCRAVAALSTHAR